MTTMLVKELYEPLNEHVYIFVINGVRMGHIGKSRTAKVDYFISTFGEDFLIRPSEKFMGKQMFDLIPN